MQIQDEKEINVAAAASLDRLMLQHHQARSSPGIHHQHSIDGILGGQHH